VSVHIKKIDKVTSFCGLNKVVFDTELKGYNVIFANNGAGKTSITSINGVRLDWFLFIPTQGMGQEL